jgi:uncharacterized protein
MNQSMKDTQHTYTLITGASAGLGRQLAIQCARQQRNLILLALPGRDLRSLAQELEDQYMIKAVSVELDLTEGESIRSIAEKIIGKYSIDMLINNAGIGGTADLEQSTLEEIDRIIQLNIRATALITRMLIPALTRHPRSYIMNISSMAAFTPMAYKTVYPASKAFIYSFSVGLNEEYKDRGLSVSVIHPGPILTNFDTTRRIIEQGRRARLGLLPTQRIAAIALQGTLEGKPVIVPGAWNQFNAGLIKMMPLQATCRWISGIIKKELDAPQYAQCSYKALNA